MPVTCPACGQQNPDGFRLCGMCGAALTAAAPHPREERKVVTVLFCDLVGSTARAETMDPEDVRALLARFHGAVRAELERHGGTVEKFIGDAVMALFGAPTAHEDDPERAVRAALAIREVAEGDGTDIRIGITTGEALITLGANPAEGEGMASGDVVNTAARLQAAAPVNGILVGEATFRATRHVIDYTDHDPIAAKGKAQPIAAWLATEARSRFGADVTHQARTSLVGRDRELRALVDALERSRAERTTLLVTLVGVPGMGKSRLVHELRGVVDAQPDLITWRQGRCLAYGEGMAYWALADVIKAQAGIDEQDDPAAADDKLRDSVGALVADPGDQRWMLSHLRPLVGLERAAGLGGDKRGEAFAAWRRYLEALAERRPTVLVIEDLHWADDGLLDFVDELVAWLTDVPMLVVCTARPELLERRPAWGGGKLNAITLALSPLSTDQTAALLREVLAERELPAEVARRLLERVEGNPLYAEQFAELVRERGPTVELTLPENLQGLLAARLDGLAPDEKSALQDAAVMGKVFWSGAVSTVERPDPLLLGLARKGFLARQRQSSVERETEWSFAHMLLRDVAYGQIPRAERSRKHRRAAEWIAALGRPEDQAGLLAHHWRTALELAESAGLDTDGLVEPTRLALRAAGDRSMSVNAYLTAAADYDHAIARWPADDLERPELLFRRAEALYLAGDDRAREALAEARDALIAAGDRQRAAEAEANLARSAWISGHSDEARAHERRAEELAGGEPSRATALVLATIARTRTISGDAEDGLGLARTALEQAERLGLDEVAAHALGTIGLARCQLGDAGGDDDIRRSMERGIELRSSVAASSANNLAVNAFFDLDLRRATPLYEQGLRIAEQLGDASGARWMRGQHVNIAFYPGDWDLALERAEAFLAEVEAGSPHYLEGTVRSFVARIADARGDVERAMREVTRAVQQGRRVTDAQDLLAQLGLAASLSFDHGQVDEARGMAIEIVQRARNNPQDAAWTLGLEFVASPAADDVADELREVLAQSKHERWKALDFACLDHDYIRAAELWAEAGGPAWEARLRLRAAEDLAERGRSVEAREQAERALVFYRGVRATAYVARLERLIAG